jgi:hypothetical protein
MKIILEKKMPNGAVAAYHLIDRVISEAGSNIAIVTSRTASDAMAWQEPVTIFGLQGEPIISAADLLIASQGYLEGGLIVVDPTPLEMVRLTMLSRVDRIRETKVNEGCDTPSGRVQTDDVSIRNILGSVQTASLSVMLNQPFSIQWRMADNSLPTLDASAMIAMGVAVMSHVKACYTHSWEIKDAITAADTIEAIKAIDLESGWSGASS